MKRKDYFIGLNGLILIYLLIVWSGSGSRPEDLVWFLKDFSLVIIWALGNLFYWYRVKE